MEAYGFPSVRVISVEPIGPAAPTAEAPGHSSLTAEHGVSGLPDYWNACLDVISEPIETLNPVQRTAAVVSTYEGYVMNGGHASFFDANGELRDPELLQALKDIGALKHARILEECYFLCREAKRSRSERQYVAETMLDLDMQGQHDA